MIALLAFWAGAAGIERGQPTWYSPHQDAVAPLRALGFVERFASLPERTADKYPVFAYLYFGAAARLALALRGDAQADALLALARERGPDAWANQVDPDFWSFAELLRDALSDCIVMGQWFSALAHLLLVLASAALVAELFTDRSRFAAPLAALLTGFHPYALFYAHPMNVDTPCLAFATLALFFFVRLLKRGGAGAAVGCGVCAALAAGMKDQIVAFLAFVPFAGLVLLVRWRRRGAPSPAGVRPWLVAAVAFFATYALAADLVFAADAWVRHVRFGMSPEIREQYALAPPTVAGWLELVRFSGALFVRSAGFPGAVLMLVGLAFALARRRAVAVLLLAPAVAYWVLFVLRLGLTYPRHLLPAFLPLCWCAAGAIAALFQSRGLARAGAVVLLLLLPAYVWRGVTVNRLWQEDPRERAARWLVEGEGRPRPGERVLVVSNHAVPPPIVPATLERKKAYSADLVRTIAEFDPQWLVQVISPLLANVSDPELPPPMPAVGTILGSGADALQVVAVFERRRNHPILEDIDALPEVLVLRRQPKRP